MRATTIIATVILLVGEALAQSGGCKQDIALNKYGQPAAGASIRVCQQGAPGTPCNPTVAVYRDAALTQALTNPFLADAFGNYSYCTATGYYVEQSTFGGSTFTKKDVTIVSTAAGTGINATQIQAVPVGSPAGPPAVPVFNNGAINFQTKGALDPRDYAGADPQSQIDAACLGLGSSTGMVVAPFQLGDGRSFDLTDGCGLLDLRGGRQPDSGGNLSAWSGGVGIQTRWTTTNPGEVDRAALMPFAEAFSGGHNGTYYGGSASKSNYTSIDPILVKRTPGQGTVVNSQATCTSVGDCFGNSAVLFHYGGLVIGVGDEGAVSSGGRVIYGDSNGSVPPDVLLGTVSSVGPGTVTLQSHSNSFSYGDYRPLIITTPAKIYSTGSVTVTAGGTSIVGAGTSWLTLCPGGVACSYNLFTTDLFFSLDHYDVSGGGRTAKWVIPICAIADNTHATVCTDHGTGASTGDYNGAAQTYKFWKGALTTQSATPLPWQGSLGTVNVTTSVDFTAGDTVEQPVHWNWQATGETIGCLQMVGPPGCNGQLITNIAGVNGNIAQVFNGPWNLGVFWENGTSNMTAYTFQYTPGTVFSIQDSGVNGAVDLFQMFKRGGGLANFYYQFTDGTNLNYWNLAGGQTTIDATNGGATFGYGPSIGWAGGGYALGASAFPNYRDAIMSVPVNNTTSRILTSQFGGVYYYGFNHANAMFGKGIKLQGGTGDITQTGGSIASPTWQIDGSNGNSTFNQVSSTVATGTAPMVVASTTQVSNLNASLVQGLSFTTLSDAPGAITVNANSCTERTVAFATAKTTASVTISPQYALDANIYVSPGAIPTLNTNVKYRICNPTAGNITLNAAAAFNLTVLQ